MRGSYLLRIEIEVDGIIASLPQRKCGDFCGGMKEERCPARNDHSIFSELINVLTSGSLPSRPVTMITNRRSLLISTGGLFACNAECVFADRLVNRVRAAAF